MIEECKKLEVEMLEVQNQIETLKQKKKSKKCGCMGMG